MWALVQPLHAGFIDPAVLQRTWPQSDTLLNSTLMQRGMENIGSDVLLGCIRGALAAGRRLSISAIGGSITAGSSYAAGTGSAADFLFHRKVALALDAMYPVPSGHGRHNGGVPGTGPTYMEHCVHDHLASDVDLVLLEYAVNTDRSPASFERLLRKILTHPRSPALIVVNAHRWRTIRPHDGRIDKCWHKQWPLDLRNNRTQWLAQTMGRINHLGAPDHLAADEDDIAALCAHYNVPLVSMRAALVQAVRAGAVAIPTFMNDCKHPNGVGHTFLAQLILQRLLLPSSPVAPAGSNVGGSPLSTSLAICGSSVQSPILKEPYFGAKGREMASSVCARGEQLARYVEPALTDGFNLTDEGRGKGKLGYVAHDIGRSISMCLPWPAPGGKAKPPQVLWLGFLRSYEHMGRVKTHCSGACGCPNDVIDGHDIKDGVSVTDVRRIPLRPSRREDSADGCCRVKLRIAAGTSSGEHKFKVMSLLLGGADAQHLQVFSLRVAASASETPADMQSKPRRRRKGMGAG